MENGEEEEKKERKKEGDHEKRFCVESMYSVFVLCT